MHYTRVLSKGPVTLTWLLAMTSAVCTQIYKFSKSLQLLTPRTTSRRLLVSFAECWLLQLSPHTTDVPLRMIHWQVMKSHEVCER